MQHWQDLGPGAGVYRHEYDSAGFGPTNSVALLLGQRGLALASAPPAPDEATISALIEIAPLAALIAPSIGHLSGLADWKERFPDIPVYAPDAQVEAVARLTKDTPPRPLSTLSHDGGIDILAAPGTRAGGLFYRSERGSRPVIGVDEILLATDAKPRSLVTRLGFLLTGTRGPLGLNRLYAKMLCNDAPAQARLLLDWMQDDPICVPAHGDPIASDEALAEARSALASLLGEKVA